MAANLERLAEKMGQAGYPQMKNLLNAAANLGRELGVPESFLGSEAVVPVEINLLPPPEQTFLKDVLDKAIAELKTNPFSPEAVTKYWRAKLQVDGKRAGLDISVPYCDWTEVEIREQMRDNKGEKVPSMMVYVPQELIGEEELARLGQMYPQMNSWAVQKGNNVQDSLGANTRGGWIKVEASVGAPNCNTTEEDLKKHARNRGYFPQRLITYIFASQASKDLTGYYLDEGSTWSRLGSRHGGRTVDASFVSDGSLGVGWVLNPRRHDPGWGGRFEEVKKA